MIIQAAIIAVLLGAITGWSLNTGAFMLSVIAAFAIIAVGIVVYEPPMLEATTAIILFWLISPLSFIVGLISRRWIRPPRGE